MRFLVNPPLPPLQGWDLAEFTFLSFIKFITLKIDTVYALRAFIKFRVNDL